MDKYWNPAWKTYGSVNGTFYAAPLGANMKSFVWYSPAVFAEKGYTVPTTWDELFALSDKMVADGINDLLADYKGTTRLLIEISAGSGNVIGDTFDEVRDILKRVKREDVGAFGYHPIGHSLAECGAYTVYVYRCDLEGGHGSSLGFHQTIRARALP